MKKINLIIAIVLTACAVNFGVTKEKTFKKNIKTTPEQKIEISGPSSTKLFIAAWDKNEVQLDLKVSIEANKDKIENDYIENFEIEEYRSGASVVIEIIEPDEDNSWNLWDLITSGHISVQTNVRGTIYVPRNNNLELEFKYGDLRIENIAGELVVSSRSSKLQVNGCSNLVEISNEYGDSELIGCAGALEFEGRSSPIKIFDFKGSLKVYADYAETQLKNIVGNVILDARGTEIKVERVNGSINVNAPYTDVNIQNISGKVYVSDRSSDVTVADVGGFELDGAYCNLNLSEVSGSASKIIDIKNQSGEIKISNAKGNVEIDDSYSDMSFKDITGNMNISARSNTITADHITGNWNSSSQYSTIILKNIFADSVTIENRSNDIEIGFGNSPKFINTENEYGGVKVTLPENFQASYDLKASYGEINSEFPIAFKTTSNGVVSTFKREKDDAFVRIMVHSGNIDLISK